MGLDISVYQNVELCIPLDENDGDDYSFMAFVVADEFRDRIKNLKYNEYYTGDLVYNEIGYPYSIHSRFREYLLKVIGRSDLLCADGTIKWDELKEDIPFYKFINFADNEGCLDWEVSAELLQSFISFESESEKMNNGRMREIYKQWMKAFEFASIKGVVVFH